METVNRDNEVQVEDLEVLVSSWGTENKKTFRNKNVCLALDISSKRATQLLDRYQLKQNTGNTAYLIHRVADTRCNLTVWRIGHKTRDAEDIYNQVRSDIQKRVDRIVKPLLLAVAGRNRHARVKVNAAVNKIHEALDLLFEEV